MSFKKFQFKNYIAEALEELKFTTPTEVQEKPTLSYYPFFSN